MLTQQVWRGRFTISLIFLSLCSALEAVKSIDFFDTLAGRYQYDPKSIFRLMGRELRDPQWEHVRRRAEKDARGGLLKIYNVIGKSLSLMGEDLERLRQMELLLEASNLFPINENINLLEAGDWIVSDTYYSEAELRSLMCAVGIKDAAYNVHASINDKASGAFWRDKAKFYGIQSHIGDNVHSDVNQALKYGIRARHYTDGRLNDFEQGLWNQGCQQLAACCRMVRLRRPGHISEETWSVETLNSLLSLLSRQGRLTEGLVKDQLQQMSQPLAVAEMHNLIVNSLYFYPNLESEIRSAYGSY